MNPGSPATPRTADSFRPPTAEQLRDHLVAHTPRPRAWWWRHLPLGILVATVVASLATANVWAALLPWAALVGLLLHGARRARELRQRQRGARYTQELAMLRHRPQALRRGWRLLPQLVHDPVEHTRIVTVMAHLLDDLGQPDAAMVAFDHLLEGMPTDHPGAFAMHVQRAILFFHHDRLADGDDTLRKLRNTVDRYEGTPLGAAYHVARLVQSVKTHHFAEGVEDVTDPVTTFRPLGVESGYGHALLALCLRHTGRFTEADDAWRRATLLLPADTLTRRFPELDAMRTPPDMPGDPA